MKTLDISVVLGTLNRKRLLALTLNSIRENGFEGEREIIVVDGGSTDGTCNWLAGQRDVLTIVQPNYPVKVAGETKTRKHSWGEFINLGFQMAQAPWVLMISDDLLLCRGAIHNGLKTLRALQNEGQKLGGGAMFWRDYPRDRLYRVNLLAGNYVHINHGFFNREALEDVGYADEHGFDFYGADGDLTIRLNQKGWKTVPLEDSFAEHLNHRARWANMLRSSRGRVEQSDMQRFYEKYRHLPSPTTPITKAWVDRDGLGRAFWRVAPWAFLEGALRNTLGR